MKVSKVEITADESGVWVKINNEYLQGVKSVEFKKSSTEFAELTLCVDVIPGNITKSRG